jgi:Tfp pilus assembly protein PilF
VTASIVGMIAPKVEQAEIERAKRKPVISVDAYDHLLRAVARLYQLTGEATDDALRQFDAAIERDPDAATAHALKAFCYSWRFFNGWMADPGTERADAERHARRAVELAGDDADVLAYSGYTLAAVNGDFDDSAALIDRALELNPNLAKGWGASAWLRVFVGEPDRAIDHAMKAIRLSPIDLNIQSIRNAVGQAHFFAGRFGDAASWARLALQAKADFRPALRLAAAAEALSDNLAAARKYREQLQQLDPEACLAASMKVYSSYRPEHAAKLREGLRLAGLPE